MSTENNIGSFIVNLIQTVVFMTPVVLLFYKQGKKDQVIEELVRDVNGLGKKVSGIEEAQAETLTELKKQIDNINNTLIRVTTTMEFIQKSIEELKSQNA